MHHQRRRPDDLTAGSLDDIDCGIAIVHAREREPAGYMDADTVTRCRQDKRQLIFGGTGHRTEEHELPASGIVVADDNIGAALIAGRVG